MKIIHTYSDNHTKLIYHKQSNKHYIRSYKQGFYMVFALSKSQEKKLRKFNQLPKEVKQRNLILNNDTYRVIKKPNKRLTTNLNINKQNIQTTTNRYKQAYQISNDTGIEINNITKLLYKISITEINNILKH